MKLCNQLEDYRDGELSQLSRVNFEKHLESCFACASQVEDWSAVGDVIKQDAAARAARTDAQTELGRRRLVTAFGQRTPGFNRRVWVLAPVAAAAGCLILGILIFFSGAKDTPKESGQAGVMITHFADDGTKTDNILKPGESMVMVKDNERILAGVGDDLVAVGAGGRVKFDKTVHEDTQLVLNRGWVACSVSRRSSGERFAINTAHGDYTVEVKGTLFGVNYRSPLTAAAGPKETQFQVVVVEGEVVVTQGDDQRWTLTSDRQLLIRGDGTSAVARASDKNSGLVRALLSRDQRKFPALEGPSDKMTVADSHLPDVECKSDERAQHGGSLRPAKNNLIPPSATEIKRWMVAGQYVRAIRALKRQLVSDSKSSELWRLLAVSKQKTGDFEGAVAAYKHVIALGSPPAAMTARFRAGLIYQNQINRPADAAHMFSQYLLAKGPKPLRAEALLHLGKADLSLGRTGPAKEHFNEVIEKHGATAAAVEARKLILKI